MTRAKSTHKQNSASEFPARVARRRFLHVEIRHIRRLRSTLSTIYLRKGDFRRSPGRSPVGDSKMSSDSIPTVTSLSTRRQGQFQGRRLRLTQWKKSVHSIRLLRLFFLVSSSSFTPRFVACCRGKKNEADLREPTDSRSRRSFFTLFSSFTRPRRRRFTFRRCHLKDDSRPPAPNESRLLPYLCKRFAQLRS